MQIVYAFATRRRPPSSPRLLIGRSKLDGGVGGGDVGVQGVALELGQHVDLQVWQQACVVLNREP